MSQMTEYDRVAWLEIQEWKQRKPKAQVERLIPSKVRGRMSSFANRASERIHEVPHFSEFEAGFHRALSGLTDLSCRASSATVAKRLVISRFTKHGLQIRHLRDVRELDLESVDDVAPRLGLRYSIVSSTQGAVAGLVVSGGGLAATTGILGAGAAAAPGAGLVVGTLAADAAAVLFASQRVVAHTAAFYGYDVDRPAERLIAAGVLNVAMSTNQAGKAAAFTELNKLVQALARNQAWSTLNVNHVTKIVNLVYARLGMKITKQKLAQAVPAVGIVVGAGLNARTLSRVADTAHFLYRERFLQEKYGPAEDFYQTPSAEQPDCTPDDHVSIIDIVDEHLSSGDDNVDEAA